MLRKRALATAPFFIAPRAPPLRLFALLALAMLAFAANSVLNRMAVGAGHIDALGFTAVRVIAGVVTLAALMQARGTAWPGLKGRLPGVLGLTTYLLGFSLAYQSLDAGAGALILFGCVQLTMFAGALLYREAVPTSRWMGAAVAFGGLVLLLWPGAGAANSLPHALLMVGAGIGWGVYSLAGRGQPNALAATAANFLGSVPLIAGLWLLMGDGSAQPLGIALATLSGAITSALGYALWYSILPALGSSRAAVAQLTVPVLAAAGGALLLQEPIGLIFILAATIVLSGVALALVGSKPRP